MIRSLIVLMLATATLSARPWTDVKGRTMEADLKDATDTHALLLRNGKEFSFPIARLSPADREFVRDWRENKPPPPPKQLWGTTLVPGETVDAEKPMSEEMRKLFSKHMEPPTGMFVRVYLPANFDPSAGKPFVFWPGYGLNNKGEWMGGSVGKMRWGGDPGQKNGYLVIGYRTDKGAAIEFGTKVDQTKHEIALNRAVVDAFEELWPDFRQWNHVTGGFSASGKGAYILLAILAKNDCNIRGQVSGGVNQVPDVYARVRPPKKAFRNARLWVSTAKADNLVSEDQLATVLRKSEKIGYAEIRSETYEGGHRTNDAHIFEALAWFETFR